MGKILKIILIIILIGFILFLLIIGIGLYVNYQDYKWHQNAENMGSIVFGSSPFNEKLSSCSPSWGGQYIGESWEIRGLDKNQCIVILNEPDVKYEEREMYPIKVTYTTLYCELPYIVYLSPENIEWSEDIFKSKYCTVN